MGTRSSDHICPVVVVAPHGMGTHSSAHPSPAVVVSIFPVLVAPTHAAEDFAYLNNHSWFRHMSGLDMVRDPGDSVWDLDLSSLGLYRITARRSMLERPDRNAYKLKGTVLGRSCISNRHPSEDKKRTWFHSQQKSSALKYAIPICPYNGSKSNESLDFKTKKKNR